MSDQPSVLWLTPNIPENVSVGRQRVAEHLRGDGIQVTLRAAAPRNITQIWSDLSACDVLVGTTRAGGILGALFSSLTRTPLVIDHIDPIRQFAQMNPRWLSEAVRIGENLSFRLSDHVLYVYDEEDARVSSRAKRQTQTSLGIEYDLFANPNPEAIESVRSAFEKHGISDRVVVYVGGLEPIYHLEDLLEAVSSLDGWTLVVVGAGSLEGLFEAASDRRSDVEFFGTVPHEEVPGYLHLADVGACLVDDQHTLKVLEYGAAGLPVVQLDGRARERYGDMVTYCSASPLAIAEAIEKAANIPGGQLKEYASQHDWGEIAETYAKVIRGVA